MNEQLSNLVTEAIEADGPVVCVIKCKHYLTLEVRERIRHEWKALVAGNQLEGVPVVVLDQGIELDILRTTTAEIHSLEKRVSELESGTLRRGDVAQ